MYRLKCQQREIGKSRRSHFCSFWPRNCKNVNSKHSEAKSYAELVINWYKRRRKYGTENIQKFCKCISALSFSDVIRLDNVSQAFCNFYNLICLFYDLCFPILKVKINNTNNKLLWLTKGFKKCCKTTRLLKMQNIKYYRIGCIIDWMSWNMPQWCFTCASVCDKSVQPLIWSNPPVHGLFNTRNMYPKTYAPLLELIGYFCDSL